MKMNDELKAYVNAYMDGLEVEYRFNARWYVVESFSDFDDTSADYRIKPINKEVNMNYLELYQEDFRSKAELYQEDFRSKAVWQDVCDTLEVSSDTGYIVLREDGEWYMCVARTEVMKEENNDT